MNLRHRNVRLLNRRCRRRQWQENNRRARLERERRAVTAALASGLWYIRDVNEQQGDFDGGYGRGPLLEDVYKWHLLRQHNGAGAAHHD